MTTLDLLKEGEVADVDVAGSTGRGLGIDHVDTATFIFFHISWGCLLKSKILQE